MGMHSGKWAAINGIGSARQWTINERQSPARGIASNTAFGPVRKKGVFSWDGSYQAYGGTPIAMPGTLFGFVGYGAPDDDVSGAGQRYEGNGMVSGVTLTWNWGSGEYIGHTVNFAGSLKLNKTSGTMPVDATAPDMPPIALAKPIEWAPVSGAPLTALPHVASATLNITCALQAAVNSGTVVGTGTAAQIWTDQKAGPIDWNVSISQQDDSRVSGLGFDIGDDLTLRLYVDPTLFWLLKWAHVREFTGFTADRESGALLARTINLDMTGYVTGTGLGTVTQPSGTVWWPFP